MIAIRRPRLGRVALMLWLLLFVPAAAGLVVVLLGLLGVVD